jgi:hypothetical protein
MFVKTALAGIICNLAISGLGFAVLIRPIPVMNPTIATLETMLTATQNPIALNYSRMGIGGVRLGMSVEAAKRKLGKPQRDETKPAGPAIGGKIRTLTYQGLTVAAWEGKVYLMSTTNPKFTTIDGVKVGDSKQKVIKTYGFGSQSVEGNVTRWLVSPSDPSHPEPCEGSGLRVNSVEPLIYSNDQKASNLMFELRGDRVQKIICGTQLN